MEKKENNMLLTPPLFLDALDELVVHLDGGFNIQYANTAFLEKTGYSFNELVGSSFTKLLPEGDLPDFQRLYSEARPSENRKMELEHRLIHKNGSTDHFKTIAVPGLLRDRRQVVMLRLKCIADMVREKENLEIVRTLYVTIAEQASESFLMHDQNGRILDVNRYACDKLGYTQEELLAMNVADLDENCLLEEAKADWAKIKPGESFVVHSRHKRRDNTILPVKISVGCVQIGDERFYLGLATDLSGIEQAEKRYKTIVEAAPEPIFIQTEHQFAYLNPAACAFFGISSPEELLGTPIADRFDPEYRDVILDRIRRLNEERQPVVDFQEYRFLGKNGVVWGETSGVPIEYGGKNGALVFLRDVTRRKEIEAALRASERKYEQLFYDAAVPILVEKLPEHRIIDVNDAWVRLFGFSKEEAIGKSALELGIASDYISDETIYELIRTSDTVRNLESKHYTKSGEERTLLTNISFTESGGETYLFVTNQDITERKRAEEQLFDSNELFRKSFENSALPTCLNDIQGRLLAANRMMCRVFGYTRKELEGKLVTDVSHPDDFPISVEMISKLIDGEEETVTFEKRYIRKNGEIFIAIETAAVIRDKENKPVHIVTQIQDITESRQLMDELKSNAARLKAIHEFDLEILRGFESLYSIGENAMRYIYKLLEADMVGIGILGLDDSVIHVVKSLGGDKTAERYEVSVTERELAQLSEMTGPAARGIKKEKPLAVTERIFKCPGIYSCTDIPIFTAGRLRGIVSIGFTPPKTLLKDHNETVQDMATQIALAIEQTRLHMITERYATSLEQMIRDRTAELEEANKELESFTFSVSHDLRAPLRSMHGFVRILLEDYGQSLDDEGRRVCGVIANSAQNMGQLIDDLLALSRVGRSSLEMTDVDMRSLAERVFTELTDERQRSLIDFSVGVLPDARADLHLMRQVWVNLIDNAIKFTSRRAKPMIRITAETKGDETVYAVEDNGAGFNMAYKDKLFNVFQRLHSQKEFTGTGVGLAIVARIVRRHGGNAWAYGEENNGATFYFSLKREDEGSAVRRD